MHGKFVCLSYASDAFCVARSWTLTVAFKSLGHRYTCAHILPATSPTGSLREGGGLSCQVTE